MKKREIEGILERLREIAGTHVDREMCEKVGIKYGTLDNWKVRDSIPSKRLRQIALNNNANPVWLEFGEGEMLKNTGSTSMTQSGLGNNQVLGSGNSIGRVEERGHRYEKEARVSLPYYPEVYASAGGGAYPYLSESEPMDFSKTFLEVHLGLSSFKGIFMLNATGESMEPTLGAGALIFVNPIANEGEVVRDGGIYVIMCENMMLVKRVEVDPITQIYTLKSDNNIHKDIVIDMKETQNCKFVGRVVGSFDKI